MYSIYLLRKLDLSARRASKLRRKVQSFWGHLKILWFTSIIILKKYIDSTQFSVSFYQLSKISIEFDQGSRKPNRF